MQLWHRARTGPFESWPFWSPARHASRRHWWWQAYCGDVWQRSRPFQYMDGETVIYLASRHLPVQPQPLLRVGREALLRLCPVRGVDVALGRILIEWLLRGNFIYFSSQTVNELDQRCCLHSQKSSIISTPHFNTRICTS